MADNFHIVVSLVFLGMCLNPCLSSASSFDSSDISLQRFTRNEGLHRDLISKIKFHGSLSSTLCSTPNQCILLIKETVPSGIYLDLHQLKDPVFVKNQDIQIFSPHKFDTEAAEQVSAPQPVYVYVRFRSRDVVERCGLSVTLPVHLRYHAPGPAPANVSVPNPRLAYRCKDNGEKEGTMTAPCSAKRSDKECRWTPLPRSGGSDIVLQVPVADPSFSPLVTYGTLFVAALGALYLIVVTLRYKSAKSEKTD